MTASQNVTYNRAMEYDVLLVVNNVCHHCDRNKKCVGLVWSKT